MSMSTLIEKMFELHGVKDSDGSLILEGQVTFVGGQGAAGAMKRGPVEGSYVLLVPLLDKRTQVPSGAIQIFFLPEAVSHIDVPIKAEPPSIVTPRGNMSGNLVLP